MGYSVDLNGTSIMPILFLINQTHLNFWKHRYCYYSCFYCYLTTSAVSTATLLLLLLLLMLCYYFCFYCYILLLLRCNYFCFYCYFATTPASTTTCRRRLVGRASHQGIMALRLLNDHPHYLTMLDAEEQQEAHGVSWLSLPFLSAAPTPDHILSMAVSPCGARLATLHMSGAVAVWALPSFTLESQVDCDCCCYF